MRLTVRLVASVVLVCRVLRVSLCVTTAPTCMCAVFFVQSKHCLAAHASTEAEPALQRYDSQACSWLVVLPALCWHICMRTCRGGMNVEHVLTKRHAIICSRHS
jgi:hypothetical protein